MSLNNNKTNYKRMLNITMWLPAGKSFFGEVTSESPYDFNLDTSIAERFHYVQHKIETEYNGKYHPGYKTEHNQALGCRTLEVKFDFKSEVLNNELTGNLTIFSNGLYKWRLVANSDLRDDVRLKIADEFLHSHLIPFFGEKWLKSNDYNENKKSFDKLRTSYKGAFSFYQLELIFDGPFNTSLHPLIFLNGDNEGKVNIFTNACQVNSIIKNIVLYSDGQGYKSVIDDKVKYDWVPEKDNETKYEDNEIKYYDKSREEQLFYELLVSSEHFLRHSIAKGLLQILNSVQDIHRELLTRDVRSSTRLSTVQIYRKDVSEELKNISNVMIEAYVKLVEAKFPTLNWLDRLIDDLVVSSDDFSILEKLKTNKEKSGPNGLEYAAKTYSAAKGQFQRNIILLEWEIHSIHSGISLELENNKISILNEIRRINEFLFEQEGEQKQFFGEVKLMEEESNHIKEIIDDARNRLIMFVGIISLIITFIFGFIHVGTWTMEKLLLKSHIFLNLIPIALIFLPLLLLIFLIKLKSEKVWKRLYKYFKKIIEFTPSPSLVGKTDAVNDHIQEDYKPHKKRITIDIAVDKKIHNFGAFHDHFDSFWIKCKEIEMNKEGNDQEVKINTKNYIKEQRYNDIYLEFPNNDIKRYKYILKKLDDYTYPIESQFTIFLEINHYFNTQTDRLMNIRMMLYGKENIPEQIKHLVDNIFSNSFMEQTDIDDIRPKFDLR